MFRRTKEFCQDRLNDMLLRSGDGVGGSDERQDYRNSELRQYWMPDAYSLECYDCNLRFNTFRRKHHCRVCGQIFCSSCSSEYIDGKSLGFNGKLRVCKFCFDFFHRFLKGLEPGANSRLLDKEPSRESTPSTSLNQSAFYSVGAPFLEEDNQCQCSDVVQFSLKDPTQLGRLWAKIIDTETGVYITTVDGQFSGHDLVRWLTSRDESMGPEQAVAIGQALLDARFMVDEYGSKVFSRSETLYRSVQNSISNLEENSNVNSNASETDFPEWLQNIPESIPEEHEIADKKVSGSSNNASYLSNDTNVNAKLLSKSVLENIILSNDGSFISEPSVVNINDNPQSLDSIYSEYIGLVLKHLMAEERLNPQWYKSILHFAEKAVGYVKLNHISRNDNVDIREYISIKKIPFGSRDKDSRIFPGIMFQNRPYCGKNKINNARILLVRGSISFNRIKYASLENYISQEDEYLKNICSKIKSFKPDVIFVEKTITYQAKVILSFAQIAIVQNVKLDLLEKISRQFRTPILTSLDSIPKQPELGSCESYKVQSFVINKKFISPDFVILESQSNDKLGCTIILRGASKKTLDKVKRLIKQTALLLNNKSYEKSFLENEFVRLSAHNSIKDIHSYRMTYIPMSPFLRFSKGGMTKNKDLESWEFDDTDDEVLTEFDARDSFHGKSSALNLINTPEDQWGEVLANFRAGVSDRPLSNDNDGPEIYNLDSKFSKSVAPAYYSNPKAIPVLFSSYSPRSKAFPSYCIAPCVVEINPYGVNDLPLGIFLETFCFGETSFCPYKGCNASIKDHIRRFCLNEGVINLYIQSLVSPIHQNSDSEGGNPPIVTWKYCVECEKLGPVVELNEKSWNYSFGMFLSLLIYEDKLVGGGSEHVCSHSLHQQHYTCFSRGYLVVSFKFSKVKPFSASLPSSKIQIDPYLPSVNSMTLDVCEIATKGTLLFSKIHEKLNDLETKEGPLYDKYTEMTHKYEDNYKEFRSSIDNIKSLIERIEDPDIKEEDKTKYSLSARRHIIGMKLYLSDKSSTWKQKLSTFIDEKKKEEKCYDKTRNASGSNSGNTLATLDHVDDALAKVNSEESIGGGYGSTTSRIWQNFSSNCSEIVFPNIFPSHIHYGLDSHNYIVVDEKQPSSIVAHVLSTGNYLEKRRHEISKSSNKVNPTHYDCEFADKEKAQFYCNAYFAWEFEKLRNEILSNPKDYVQSLAECEPWKSSGGKSGLHFYKTKDDRFILKEMSGVEFNCFQEFAPQYFDYIRSALNPKEKKPSALAKILGVYKIGSKNSGTKETHKMDFLVIENVFYGCNIVEKYDLKGSMRNRLVDTKAPVEGGNIVLMDENLLKISCDRPIFIRKSCQKRLLHAIDRDTSFLQNAMIMDYSLIVGIDAKRQELVLGIIDYIRNFSWDKKLENLIKKSGLLGGKPGTTPTIIPPKIYKKRFIEAMLKYFIVLPEIADQDS